MKRPVGYAIIAILVGIMSLSGLFAVFEFPESMDRLRIVIPPFFYALMILQVLLGAAVTWSLWMYRRNAPELFLAWGLIGLVSSFYSSRVMMPQLVRAVTTMMPAGVKPPDFPASMVFSQIAFDVMLAAAAYWYLASRRRPGMLVGAQAAATESPT
jgi:hypothetical protein